MIKQYEVLFMVKPDLGENVDKTLFSHINDAITKNSGTISSSGLWSERRKLYFTVKKCREAIYYLVEFAMDSLLLGKIKSQYRLNEDILRFMIIRKD